MNNAIKNKILSLTLELKDQNPESHKHFTFLVSKNRILTFGQNFKNTTHPIAKKFNKRSEFIHSELDAIIKLRWYDINWSKVTLVNTRVNRDGIFGMSKPCIPCQKFIKQIGIKKIYFTNKDGIVEKL